jgi:serine/threonine-protein kinase
MDERCVREHAKLLAGTCPWCGRAIINGRVNVDLSTGSYCESVTYTTSITQVKVFGPSLKQLVEREGPLDWQQAVRYIAEVAHQLAELHSAQQVHRNVRPNNIYLGQENEAELGPEDHEFASASINEESIPSIVDCLAPEQALNSQVVDGRADIYSLGCTFYFLLAGRMPFPSGTVAERLLQHQTGTPESLTRLRPDLPATVVQVCEKMMAKKAADRYAAAQDVVDALAKIEAEE